MLPVAATWVKAILLHLQIHPVLHRLLRRLVIQKPCCLPARPGFPTLPFLLVCESLPPVITLMPHILLNGAPMVHNTRPSFTQKPLQAVGDLLQEQV